MLSYIIQVMLFQVLFLAVYDLFLSKETFFTKNRWYLLSTVLVSFVLPLLKIPTLQKQVPETYIIELPEIVLAPQKVIESTSWYQALAYLDVLFAIGSLFFCILFFIKLGRILHLIYSHKIEQQQGYKLILLPKKRHAFSFFGFIFLGAEVSKEEQKNIIQHELIHSQQRHSLDLLLFEILKIAMWFNPMLYLYQKRITLIHEYISDEAIASVTSKEHYIQSILSGIFQVENISFINQFYKHSLIKKRVLMMTKQKSKSRKQLKYLLLVPLLASMLLYTSCNQENSAEKDEKISKLEKENAKLKAELEEKEAFLKSDEIEEMKKKKKILSTLALTVVKETYKNDGSDVPISIIEEAPIFPGCTGTRAEKLACLNKNIRKHVFKNFNASIAKELSLPKGKQKIYVGFKIDNLGNIVDIVARASHQKLREEAERVTRTLPKMKPGKQRGKAVTVKYTIPISFNVE